MTSTMSLRWTFPLNDRWDDAQPQNKSRVIARQRRIMSESRIPNAALHSWNRMHESVIAVSELRRVFGADPVADPVGVLSRIGYLSEENDLPGWMRIEELIRYQRAFYPRWDGAYAEELRQAFALDPTAKIKTLSKGQKARVGLLIALAYRPELLVLDEPSSGLDPIVRRDILGAVIRTIADEGRTVLFSSHLLGEVEQVADHVTMIHHGKIVLSAPLDAIRESHRVGERVRSLDEIFVALVGMAAAPAREA